MSIRCGFASGFEDLALAARESSDPAVPRDRSGHRRLPLVGPLGRGVSIDDVSLRGVTLTVVHRADGTSNLPAGGKEVGSGSAAAPTARIGRFDVRGLTVDWRDETESFALQLPSTSIHLTGGEEAAGAASGSVAMNGTARIRVARDHHGDLPARRGHRIRRRDNRNPATGRRGSRGGADAERPRPRVAGQPPARASLRSPNGSGAGRVLASCHRCVRGSGGDRRPGADPGGTRGRTVSGRRGSNLGRK